MEWRFPAALFMSLTLLLLGLSCLLWPKAMQRYSLKHKVGWRFKTNTALDWMETPRYLLYLRLLGAAVAVIGTFATMFLAKKFVESWFI
jgi:hypothetical protein